MEKTEAPPAPPPRIRWNYLAESKASWDSLSEVAIRVLSDVEFKAGVGQKAER